MASYLREVGGCIRRQTGWDCRALAFKVPSCLRIDVPATNITLESLQKIVSLSCSDGPAASSRRTLPAAVDKLYAYCKGLGTIDQQAPQRFSAPQDAGNCLHKSVMAFLGNYLPEPAFRLFRRELMMRGAQHAHRAKLPEVRKILAAKAAKATLRCDNPMPRQATWRPADVPAVCEVAAGAFNKWIFPKSWHDTASSIMAIGTWCIVRQWVPMTLLLEVSTAALIGVQVVKMNRMPRSQQGI